MKIQIHTRNSELAEDFREIVEEKLNSMERFGVVIDRVEVEVLHETNPRQGKHSHRVVLTSHGSGPLLRAEGAEFNNLAAFDAAIKVFALQIRKIHEKSKDYKFFDRTILEMFQVGGVEVHVHKYIGPVDPTDPSLIKARQALASALY